jgi:hypothetical protein
MRRLRRPLRLYWWRHRDGRTRNVGDELSPLLVELMSGRRVVHASLETCDLVAAGSILDAAIATTGRAPIPVWGSGLLFDRRPAPAPTIAPSAVRGPATAERITGTGPLPQGDPGLLADRLLDARPPVRHRLGIVPHYVDRGLPAVAALARLPGVLVVDTTQPPRAFVEQIASCAAVLSSSLHGLVVADALGVPNRWLRLSDGVMGDGFKFRDHLRCVGEARLTPLELTGGTLPPEAEPDAIDEAYRRPGLDALRARLEAAFPG